MDISNKFPCESARVLHKGVYYLDVRHSQSNFGSIFSLYATSSLTLVND